MATTRTVRDIIQAKNQKDAPILYHLQKQSGLMATAQARLANDGIKHTYTKIKELPALTSTLLDGSVAPTVTNKNNYSVNLSLQQAYEIIPVNVVNNEQYPGGIQGYAREAIATYNESFSQTGAKSIFYGNDTTFGDGTYSAGLHQYAKAYGNVIQAGGDTGSRTTIFAVSWDPRWCTTLYNEMDINQGRMMNVDTFGGSPRMVKDNTTTKAAIYGYELHMQGYLGFVSSTKYDVAAYTQLQDAADDRPTATNLDKLLDYVKAGPNTFLYMSRNARRMVEQLADAKYQRGNGDNNYDTRLDYWNGVPIVIDENISDVETTVLD